MECEKVSESTLNLEQEKVWLKEYQAGVAAEINPDLHQSLVHILEEAFEQHSKRIAFKNMGCSLDYATIDRKSKALAAFFQNHWGLKKGDRLAIMMPNVLQYPIVLFAALRAGLIVVNINPLYTATELNHLLMDSGAKAVVVLENFAHIVEEAKTGTSLEHVCISRLGDMLGAKGFIINFVVKYIKKMVPKYRLEKAEMLVEAMRQNPKTFKAVQLNNQDIAFLQYTGGTTGVSKGAMLTHRNLISNIMQATAWLSPCADSYQSGGGVITALPLYHIFSLTANCLTFFALGVTNILITNPRDIPTFVKTLSKESFIGITGVNTLFNALLNHPGFVRLDFTQLKFSLGGGMAVQSAVAKKWKEVTGNVLLEAYGLTETSPAVCINPLSLESFNGSIGLPISSTIVSIRNESNEPCPFGEIGELCVKGPQVMKGYWQRPDETAKVMQGGWLHTGDMATMDEKGYVRIVDRIKDMINVSGFNVYPNEVEDVLAQHPDILEVAVIGVPDENTGEAVKAYLVTKNKSLDPKELIQHCRSSLTAYKVPKLIEFREELPKTNVGKVIRRALRDEALIKNQG
ncbi:MAG: long-chain-fatty-acid--CoA ligase [Legionellales bacterium]|nr:long-chain-fatty-acid--CoA ligase [Legionellales bacterium]